MALQLSYTPIRYVPECSAATIDQVVEILERWRKRSENHFSNRRRDHRFPYISNVMVIVELSLVAGEPQAPILFSARARNLSISGISLLVAPVYVPEQTSDNTPLVHVERLVPEGRAITVGLPRQNDQYLWMRGSVLRSRVVHFGFRECGISFCAKEGSSREYGLKGAEQGRTK
jgi:hypothetical protein